MQEYRPVDCLKDSNGHNHRAQTAPSSGNCKKRFWIKICTDNKRSGTARRAAWYTRNQTGFHTERTFSVSTTLWIALEVLLRTLEIWLGITLEFFTDQSNWSFRLKRSILSGYLHKSHGYLLKMFVKGNTRQESASEVRASNRDC